jgi:hypothetical protein
MATLKQYAFDSREEAEFNHPRGESASKFILYECRVGERTIFVWERLPAYALGRAAEHAGCKVRVAPRFRLTTEDVMEALDRMDEGDRVAIAEHLGLDLKHGGRKAK